MNNTLIKQTFPIIVVILILSGVYWLNNSKPLDLGANQCYLEQQECRLTINEHEIVVNFEQYPVQIEEMSAFEVTSDRQLEYRSGYLEGTNMFMGKTPVLEQGVSSTTEVRRNQLALFIGACSEPKMRWRMVLQFKDLKTEQIIDAYIYFQTKYQ